jgi:hypothetical protein
LQIQRHRRNHLENLFHATSYTVTTGQVKRWRRLEKGGGKIIDTITILWSDSRIKHLFLILMCFGLHMRENQKLSNALRALNAVNPE